MKPETCPIHELISYMKYRAQTEKKRWCIPDHFIEHLFGIGCRRFYNVTVADNGAILMDEENPIAFKDYMNGR